MIKEVTMYTVICDGCGKDLSDVLEYDLAPLWSSQNDAETAAIETDWEIKGDKHYCENCAL